MYIPVIGELYDRGYGLELQNAALQAPNAVLLQLLQSTGRYNPNLNNKYSLRSCGSVDALHLLLKQFPVDTLVHGRTALAWSRSRQVADALLDAGADPKLLVGHSYLPPGEPLTRTSLLKFDSLYSLSLSLSSLLSSLFSVLSSIFSLSLSLSVCAGLHFRAQAPKSLFPTAADLLCLRFTDRDVEKVVKLILRHDYTVSEVWRVLVFVWYCFTLLLISSAVQNCLQRLIAFHSSLHDEAVYEFSCLWYSLLFHRCISVIPPSLMGSVREFVD